MAILVVPAVAGKVSRLSQLNCLAGHPQHLILWKVLTHLRPKASGRLEARWVQPRPGCRDLHQVAGRLPEEHRAGLKVDGFVLHAHEDGPQRVIPGDLHRRSAVVILEIGMSGNDLAHDFVDLLPVLLDLLHGRPDHVILVHVIPKHLVDSNLHDRLHVRVHCVLQHSSHPQLVDVQAGSVSVVKDLWMPQAMHRRTVEGLLAMKASEKHLDHCPGVVEVLLRLLPGNLVQIGHGQCPNGPIRRHSGAQP
mmetsp:Transcript_13414/g.31937  ORF Transcript_13414/g.31937 Transcript_13414/m.31937 type:complete len:250 (+) Transcript_13414:1785-2534(+)